MHVRRLAEPLDAHESVVTRIRARSVDALGPTDRRCILPPVDTTPVEETLRRFFAATPGGVVAAYLFGSEARGQAGADSDVDVAVLLEAEPDPTLDGLRLDLRDALEEKLRRPVDLVVLNRVPVDLVHRVLRDGRLVLDADPSVRVEFEVRARNEYFDLLPILREYRESVSASS